MEAAQAAILRAKETGDFDYDPKAAMRENALMQGLQKLNQIDSILENKMTGFQQQLAQQQAHQTQQMEQQRLYRDAESKFTSELDKVLANAPELEVQRDAFMRQHQADPRASAQDVAGWAADLAKRARVTRAAGKNAAARRQPRSASGPSSIPSTPFVDETVKYAGLTIREIVNAKRKELEDLT